MIKCGAFWQKISKVGTDYYSGELNLDGKKIKVVMFKNTKKEKENQPDMNVFLQEEKKQEGKKADDIPF